MAELLLITTLDVRGRQNNREHHVIAAMKPWFNRVTVVYRQRGRVDARRRKLLHGTTSTEHIDGVEYIAVDPALNPAEGAVRHLLAAESGRNALLRHGLDRLGIWRDRLTIRALERAAEAACRGADQPIICEAFGPWAALAARRLRKNGHLQKFVYIDRDYEPGFMSGPLRAQWAAACEATAAAAADLTLSIGHRLSARLAATNGGHLDISPTGIDVENFAPRPCRAPRPDLIFVGQVAEWSGIEEALPAIAQLRQDGIPATLTVIGPCEPAYRAHLQTSIAASGVRDAVHWRPEIPRAEVIPEMARAGIGLAVFRPHPLRIHAAPLKLLEYMASGLPMIALEGSEAGDMALAHGVGLVADCQPEAITQAVKRLMAEPDRWRSMARTGPVAAAQYDWRRVLAREYGLLAALYGLPLSARARGAAE